MRENPLENSRVRAATFVNFEVESASGFSSGAIKPFLYHGLRQTKLV
jgi:hypothetical protein